MSSVHLWGPDGDGYCDGAMCLASCTIHQHPPQVLRAQGSQKPGRWAGLESTNYIRPATSTTERPVSSAQRIRPGFGFGFARFRSGRGGLTANSVQGFRRRTDPLDPRYSSCSAASSSSASWDLVGVWRLGIVRFISCPLAAYVSAPSTYVRSTVFSFQLSYLHVSNEHGSYATFLHSASPSKFRSVRGPRYLPIICNLSYTRCDSITKIQSPATTTTKHKHEHKTKHKRSTQAQAVNSSQAVELSGSTGLDWMCLSVAGRAGQKAEE
ncbi:hypothetical protein BZA05DRAFT_35634 [Tricharina praecox]|uniref:uncharacterized protein n=1 Tax=Tricharina praecox TaxID=43433 RepID=UPI00221FA833|nr:uncharacterized protein BZA05DRAFT_229949 [Tricharina praecox]XP_051339603.1 uncharacterized protein BZA05DRAFT_35634 [Tricharina praecox]KAI5841247.1 hypothetical protein BZA05DRAFT_229949 [Tricharina praecox]KAI5852113.1 hypothetical protein BZA05DRAFT_35634 [Tricharina praecox]